MSKAPEKTEAQKQLDNGFRTAAKALTISADVLKELPIHVRDWQTVHVLAWLDDIFSGADDLPLYAEQFRRNGVKGLDLLALGEDQITSLGITSALHIGRIKSCIAQLVKHQQTNDDKGDASEVEQKEEAAYFEMERRYEDTLKQVPAYEQPLKMSKWTPFDVFYFIKQPAQQDLLKVFTKPLAMGKINGKELIEITKDENLIKFKKDLPTLVAEPRDVTRFCDAITKYKSKLDEQERRLRGDNFRELKKCLPFFDPKKLILRQKIGKGSFGNVYLAEYDKKKVVVKRLIKKRIKEHFEQNNKDSSGSLITDIELIEYEACMLLKSAGNGVVELKAIYTAKEPLSLMTEFMCRMSLEREFQLADRNDIHSIFHLYNENNQIVKVRNGVDNPVLLQMVRVARDVASAVAVLHSRGILHLDISARNIFLDASKKPKIGDFGAAAMEKDMLEMHEYRKKKIEEYGTSNNFEKRYEVDVKQETKDDDDELALKSHIHLHPRAIRWMPDSFVDCGSPRNPLLDKSVDIYSFGCLMYELATHKSPHHEATEEDVIRFKRTRQGNPSIPGDLHRRYAEIMGTCWNEREKQEGMAQVAAELTKLHLDLLVEFYKDQAKSVPIFADPDASSSMYSAPPSVYSDLSESQEQVSQLHTSSGNSLGVNVPIIVGGRVRLHFPSYVDVNNDVGFVAEYESVGILKETLVSELLSAFHFFNHTAIAACLQCIRVDNDPVQVESIALCLTHLANLAEDEHSSTDEASTWQLLCSAILRVVKVASGVPLKEFEDNQNYKPLPSVTLDSKYRAEILQHACLTVAALLRRKSIRDVTKVGVNPTFLVELCDVAMSALKDFTSDAHVVEHAAAAVESIATLSQSMLEALHKGGVVHVLLEAMRIHHLNNSVVHQCIKALGCFPIQNLIDPKADAHAADPRRKAFQSGNNNTSNSPYGGHQSSPQKPVSSEPKLSRTVIAANLARQWGEVFEGIFRIIQDRMDDPTPVVLPWKVDRKFVDKITLLEVALQALFRTCDSGVFDPDFIDCFLYTVTAKDITTLHRIVNTYPDHFRIQEGSIGLLAYIANCGYSQELPSEHNIPPHHQHYQGLSNLSEEGPPDDAPVKIPITTPSAERLSILLALDPALKSFLTAMEKFSTDDKISTGIQTALHGDRHRENTLSQGIYSSMTRSTTTTQTVTPAKYGGYGNGMQNDRSRYAAPSHLHEHNNKRYEGGDDEDFESDLHENMDEVMLEIDAEGEQVSAASLQKSVAMILGIACTTHEDIQNNLLRTRYNELILLAFKNFRTDVNLIRYGCYALFATCRRNAKHQRMLHELNVFKLLRAALKEHRDLWVVMDGVVCAIIGLLEPAGDVNDINEVKEILTKAAAIEAERTIITTNLLPTVDGLQTAEERRVQSTLIAAATARKELFDGYRVAIEITKVTKAKDIVNSTNSKDSRQPVQQTESFVSLVQTLALMVAEFQMNVECHPLVCNFLKLISAITFWLPNLLDDWSKFFVDLTVNDRLVKQVKWMQVQQKDTVKEVSTKPTTQQQIKGAISSSLSSQIHNAVAAADNDFDNKKLLLVKCNLLQFVQLSLMWHSQESFVLAAGLGVITSVIRKSFAKNGQDLPVGAALPYSESISLYHIRERSVQDGIVDFCLKAAKRREDNPILIRYSLWLLLFFISQPKAISAAFSEVRDQANSANKPAGSAMTTVKASYVSSAMEETTSADAIAADIAINGGIEWAVEVARKYTDYYSLQSLAVLFLIWMEQHGKFSSRDKDRLQDLRTVLVNNLERRVDSYKLLEDEGHDTYLTGQTVELFGKLSLHSNRLLRLVDSHLLEDAVEVDLTWDGKCHPIGVTVSAAETEEDPVTFEPCTGFVLTVQWDKVRKWTVSKRFSLFLQLKRHLEYDLQHLAPINTTQLRRSGFSKLLKTKLHSPAFIEGRREQIQSWLKEICSVRAVLFNPHFRAFMNFPTDLETKSIQLLTPFRPTPDQPTFPVLSVHYDMISSLVFIGSGMLIDQNQFAKVVDKTVVAGALNIYRFVERDVAEGPSTIFDATSGSWQCASHEMVRVLTEEFNVGVNSVAWEYHRRCVIVGLTTGPILFYHLNADCSALTYCSELDYHMGNICGMIAEPTNSVFVAAARAGTMTVFNMKEGAITCQTARSGGNFCSVAYDRAEHVAYCGSSTGAVFAMDLNKNTSEPLYKFSLFHANPLKQGRGSVAGMVFVEETRMLYASHFNNIHIFVMREKKNMSRSSCIITLTMKGGVKICDLMVINYFVIASTTKGLVAVFDISEPPVEESQATLIHNASKNLTAKVKSTLASGSASETNFLSTTTSGLVPWTEIVKRSNSAMRDWLRANGVDSSLVITRTDLIRLITAFKTLAPVTVAQHLAPDARKVKRDALLTWNLNPNAVEIAENESMRIFSMDGEQNESSSAAANSPVSPKKIDISLLHEVPFIHSACFIDDLRAIAFGCDNGMTHFVSLADFLPAPPQREKQDIAHIRSELRQVETSPEGIKGSVKSTRGKRHQIVPR